MEGQAVDRGIVPGQHASEARAGRRVHEGQRAQAAAHGVDATVGRERHGTGLAAMTTCHSTESPCLRRHTPSPPVI